MKNGIKYGFGLAVGYFLGMTFLNVTVKKLNKVLDKIEVDIDVKAEDKE